MHIAPSGRFVFVAQWILALLLPLFVVIGRGLVGSPLGWMMVIGIWFGLFGIVALYVPPVLTLFDREVRAAKATRVVYSAATWVLWVALVVFALTLVDGGDDGEPGSALTVWTGDAVSDDASNLIALIAALVGFVALVAALAFAIAGIIRGRRQTR
ncbi:hypothetical protein ACFC3F_04020 [Microbacterium sp. NPDC055910]|uniref:hypothetical protein n=1 Tax=Microbacterium sp. NPDC055910 TaxID=3345659 RepID=UPI0035E12FB1